VREGDRERDRKRIRGFEILLWGTKSRAGRAGELVGRTVSELMGSVRNTEEMSKMKVRLLALAFGFSLVAGAAYAGPLPGGLDSDNDGVENAFDNCTSIANPTQADADHNGCGDACTAGILCDADGDTTVQASDFSLVLAQWECQLTASCPSVDFADCDGDTSVGASDYGILLGEFGNIVGPSGITSAQCNPPGGPGPDCQCTPQ